MREPGLVAETESGLRTLGLADLADRFAAGSRHCGTTSESLDAALQVLNSLNAKQLVKEEDVAAFGASRWPASVQDRSRRRDTAGLFRSQHGNRIRPNCSKHRRQRREQSH